MDERLLPKIEGCTLCGEVSADPFVPGYPHRRRNAEAAYRWKPDAVELLLVGEARTPGPSHRPLGRFVYGGGSIVTTREGVMSKTETTGTGTPEVLPTQLPICLSNVDDLQDVTSPGRMPWPRTSPSGRE